MKKEAKQKNFKQILENAKDEEKIVKKMTALSIEKKMKTLLFKTFLLFSCWQKSSRSSLSASAINSGFAS